MLRKFYIKIFIILSIYVFSGQAFCQKTSRTDNVWLSLGPGFFASNPVSSIALYCSTSWELTVPAVNADRLKMREHYFKMRVIKGQGSATEDYFLRFTEVGLLYGKSFGSAVKFTAAIGLSAVKGHKSIEYRGTGIPTEESGPFFKPGIPLDIEMDLTGKYAGVGICGFADLNPGCTFAGVALILSFGKIR